MSDRPHRVYEPIPVGIVAGQSGHLQAQHQTDVSKEGDLGGQPPAESADRATAPELGQTEVLVDDDNPIGPATQASLALCAKAYCIDRSTSRLCSTWAGAGLAQIDDGHAGRD